MVLFGVGRVLVDSVMLNRDEAYHHLILDFMPRKHVYYSGI